MGKAKPLMDWEGIKAEVHRRKMTLTKLAELNGFHPTLIRKVKDTKLYEAQAVLADFIGQKPEDLWPDRYPKKTSGIFDSAKWSGLKGQKKSAKVNTEIAA